MTEEEVEKFVEWLVKKKDIQTLREELEDYYLDHYLGLLNDQAGYEMLLEIMESKNYTLN